MSINYFEFAVNQARQMAANKVLGTPKAEPVEAPEDNPDLCIVCQAHEKGVEDDTCGSMTCRETYWSEFWERM